MEEERINLIAEKQTATKLPEATPEQESQEEPSSTGSLVSIFIIVAIIIGGGIYYLFMR